MSAGFDVSVDGYAYRPDMYGNGMGWLANWAVIDAPGSRDLRWTNGSAGVEKFFKYDRFFKENSVGKFEGKEWNLRTGSMFYNENLKIFNERETFSGRFTFFTGNTGKIAEAHKGNYPFSRAYYLVKAKFVHGDIAIGAYFLRLLAEGDKMMANDGASPVYSQGGFGLFPPPKTVDMGDINHEEFYGSRGYETAEKTFEIIKNTAKCDCPFVADYKMDKNIITAKLVIPSDPNPGKQIKKIEAILTNIKTKEVVETSTDFNFRDPKGAFTGTISPGRKDSNTELQLLLKVETKDGSIIEYKTNYQSVRLETNFPYVVVFIDNLYATENLFADYDHDGGSTEVGKEFRNKGFHLSNWQYRQYNNNEQKKMISWQGNNFSLEEKWSRNNYIGTPEEEEDSFFIKINGKITTEEPYMVSGELFYSKSIKTTRGMSSVEEKEAAFTDVPFHEFKDDKLVFFIEMNNADIKKHILKFRQDIVQTEEGRIHTKFYIGQIDWSRGGQVMIYFDKKTDQ